MSLLGEKCARGGKKRTRKEFAGVPTCDECQHELELLRSAIASGVTESLLRGVLFQPV